VVIASCEDGIWLRAMIDWLTPDQREVWDYKTSGMSASPYATGKQMASGGWHVQAAMHERILDALDPHGAGRRHHYFVCQENEPPYALTVNEIGEAALTIGRKQIDYAMKLWAHCLTKKDWPATRCASSGPSSRHGPRTLAQPRDRRGGRAAGVVARPKFDPKVIMAG
jgi:hypothetical protein